MNELSNFKILDLEKFFRYNVLSLENASHNYRYNMLKKKFIKITLVFLLLSLIFIFRWSIIDNIFFTFVIPSSQGYKAYLNKELGFSANYPVGFEPVVDKQGMSVSFGRGVPEITVSITNNEEINRFKMYKNKSERYFNKGYSVNLINGDFAITTSDQAMSGAGGRVFMTYYVTNNKTYLINTAYLTSHSVYKQFLNSFKPL